MKALDLADLLRRLVAEYEAMVEGEFGTGKADPNWERRTPVLAEALRALERGLGGPPEKEPAPPREPQNMSSIFFDRDPEGFRNNFPSAKYETKKP